MIQIGALIAAGLFYSGLQPLKGKEEQEKQTPNGVAIAMMTTVYC